MQAPSASSQVLRCAVVLGATVAILSALLAPVGFWFYGMHGVWAVLLAGALCGVTGLAAYWAGRHFLDRGNIVLGVLGAMGIRMGIPLVFCLVVAIRGQANSTAGFAYNLLAFYLATLAVETWYSVPRTQTSRADAPGVLR